MIAVEVSQQQGQAITQAVDAVKAGKPLYRIGGYAGTGKTTVAKYIVEEVEDAMVCAFTGKAACRLREKGLPQAITIHRTIYYFDPSSGKFHLKPEVDGKYFLIDEGSMISLPIWNDLQTFNLPIILLGDPGQLEPIGNDPKLMHDPDIVLNQIHRQAEGCGIIQFATDIRLDRQLYQNYLDCQIYRGQKPLVKDIKWADIIICGYNRTRLVINRLIRQINGFTGLLNKDEKIIVLKNNPAVGVFNGQILTVKEVISSNKLITKAICSTDDGIDLTLPLVTAQFGSNPIKSTDRVNVYADYGYCITCHKSQGSEWDKVLVIDEQCDAWEAKRWRYTAITRAAREVRYFFK